MKKICLAILTVLLVAGALGGYVWYTWENTTDSVVPMPAITVLDTELAPATYFWSEPLLGGLLQKDFSLVSEVVPVDIGTLQSETPSLSITFPAGYETSVTLMKNGETLYNDAPDSWSDALIAENGTYELSMRCAPPHNKGRGYGNFGYFAVFNVVIPEPEPEPEPALREGRLALQQGDILSLQLQNLPPDVQPHAETELGLAVFTPAGDGHWNVSIPVGNGRLAGEYPVHLTAGEKVWDVTVTVLEFDFDEQNLIIDTTSPEITEANSAQAYQEYRDKIPPLFATWDEQRHWEGLFIQPVEGRISTQFGEIRYTNSDYSSPRSHNGMDIAVGEGTPVLAPNNGRVVLAEYLLNTGNTVVIEHGGGLKSYYFHMLTLHTQPGAMLKTGEQIGEVGTTGYSTGPHLHFEMRIGDQPISPSMLFSETAGLYSLENFEK